ncbi:hypothetical protein RB195_009846 [Necator americanus]|uniref:G-protein coupled receptors family 1 profile domain-containing protein n=1 Tax=Necator americanus TaxID=51031 RepID=A0ABR1CWE6_NECAM
METSPSNYSTSFEEDKLLMPSMIDMSKYTSVQDVLPPPNNEDLHVVVMAISYLLLFLLGTCGNVAVLTTIYHVVRSSKAALDNTLIYLVVLSCVDFGVCLSLPFTVIDQILGFWMFGTVPCKLHAVFENFGKILSALILAAMSFDRYAGVCHPQKKFLRSRKLAITILIGLAAYALITLCPLLWSFTSREIIMFARETGYRKITRMKIEKCTVDIDSQMFTAFTIYQFVLCYCTPLILIAYFYSKLLKKLREHARTFKSSHIPLMRISLYTLAVACFYFLCWTPFWMATVFAVYLENTGDSGGTVPPLFVYIMYFIHALPFTNSAINWILYGALNGQLQQRYRGRRSSKTTLTTRTAPQSTGKPAPTMNGSTTFINHPMTDALCSSAGENDSSDIVDVQLLAAHEPTYL